MSDLVKNSNYDDVYLRDLYSAICYFFIDVISINNVIDGKRTKVLVPILPSFIGSEDFIRDFFINQDKICCGESPATLLNKYPSGRVILAGNFSVDSNMLTSNAVRTKREVNVDNFFVEAKKTVYGRNTILGLNTSFNIEFRCNSIIERMKIFQSIVDNFYKERTFYFSSCGIHKIPASVVVTDQYKVEQGQQFKFSDYDGYSSLSVSFDLSTFYVVNDSLDLLTDANKVDDPEVQITPNNI